MGGANNQKFGREGDLNSDPADCFFIKANNCSGNIYQINQNKFTIQYGHHTSNRASQHKVMSIAGTFPIGTDIKEVDGNLIDQLDELITSRKSNKPVIIAKYPVSTIPFYIELHNPKSHSEFQYNDLSNVFNKGVEFRTQIASRIKIKTPDPFLNYIRRHLLWSGRCCMAISIVSTWSHLFPRITSYRLERGLSRRLDGIRR